MRKREGNKEAAILLAATREFAKHGYHRTRISKIAETAGVATGSIYLYFANKEGIILRIFDQLWMRLSTELKRTVKRQDLLPTEKLDVIIDLIFDTFTADPSLAIVYVNEQNELIESKKGNVGRFYDEYLDIAETVIREGIDRGIFRDTCDIKILRHFITGGLRTLLRLWAHRPAQFPLDSIRQNVKAFVKEGILVHGQKL